MSVIDVGYDASGNGNNWTANNIDNDTTSTGSDIMVDSPTNFGTDTGAGGEVRGNYATLNAVDKNSQIALANGNLDYTNSSSNANTQARATIAYPSTGKWYFESTRGGGGSSFAAGIGTSTTSLGTQNAGIIMYNQNGQIYVDGSLNSTPGTTFASGDTMGVAVDMDAAKVYWYKNGVVINASGLSFTVGSSTWMPMIGCYTNGDTGTLNFGQRPFAYAAPSGYKALCTQNLPDPTIADGSQYFDVLTWTGDGTNNRTITGLDFEPTAVWMKNRNGTFDHRLWNDVTPSVRLVPNSTSAEVSTFGAFNNASNGIVVSASVNDNNTSNTYVAWNWKANGAGSSNTDGTITSTVSANTTAGFSIVSFNAGAAGNKTVGHGLSSVPSLIIMKDRQSTGYGNWSVFHSSVCTTTSNYLLLNGTGALGSVSNTWGSALPTSSVFGFGSNVNIAANDDIIAYCFAPVEGYSAFGSYTGNGSADGPFVYTGFRPRWVLIKQTTTVENWILIDSERNAYNLSDSRLIPNLSNAEANDNGIDFLSNGFKLRSTNTATNESGQTHIYAAFAENPFKLSKAR